jgi:hypothetical protein
MLKRLIVYGKMFGKLFYFNILSVQNIVTGGDIKYRNINGDYKITSLDRLPVGDPTEPAYEDGQSAH